MTQTLSHDALLDRYAELTIRSGLNLQPGQQLVMTAPLDAVPLVRRITEHAYKAGASVVTTLYSDDATTLARYQHGRDESFDVAPAWLFNGMAEAFKGNAARLAIAGEDPVLFLEPKRVYRAAKGEVPEGDYTIPFGQAKIVREGQGVTVLCYGSMLHTVMEALLEEASFKAPELGGQTIVVDAAMVQDKLGRVLADEDLSRYIL